jgi:hypothetical protein
MPAKYDAERVAKGGSDRVAAVQNACLDINEGIRNEWESILRSRQEQFAALRTSQECQAVRRLYTVATKFRDALVAVQRDAFSAISDRPAFEQIKSLAAAELIKITESFAEDAEIAGVEEDLEMLRVATNNALINLPFPQELVIEEEAARQRAVDLQKQAFDDLRSGRDPVRRLQDEVETEIRTRLSGLQDRYAEWWDKHAVILQNASNRMQDAFFGVMFDVTREKTLTK